MAALAMSASSAAEAWRVRVSVATARCVITDSSVVVLTPTDIRIDSTRSLAMSRARIPDAIPGSLPASICASRSSKTSNI